MTQKQPLLEKDQVNAVMEFAEGLWLAERQGYYTPWMQNELLNNLNNNPRVPTMDTLKKALSDYKNKAEDLQSYTEFMKKWDMIFARTLESYVNVLSFDLQIVCTNAFTDDEYNSDQYKEDKKKIYKFLDSFDYRAEFRKVLKQVMTSEVGYYWFRKTRWGNKGMVNTLQLMPQKYCKLTGYWEKGLLYDSYQSRYIQ